MTKKVVKRYIVYLLGFILAILILDFGHKFPDFKAMATKNYGWPDNPVNPTYKDLVYGRFGDNELLLDIYLPEGETKNNYPVIIFIHGGGWSFGSKSLIEPSVFNLLDSGYAVASVQYSLVDEAIWPVQGEQVKGAVRWLRANAERYRLDSDKFIAYGGSSGGHLSSFLGTTNGEAVYDVEQYGNLEYSSDVQAAVALYPVTDLLLDPPFSVLNWTLLNPKVSNSAYSNLVGGKLLEHEDLAIDASPVYHVSKETTVPILILHGDKDDIVPINHSKKLAASLAENQLDYEFYQYPDYIHVDIGFASNEVRDTTLSFLNRVLD